MNDTIIKTLTISSTLIENPGNCRLNKPLPPLVKNIHATARTPIVITITVPHCPKFTFWPATGGFRTPASPNNKLIIIIKTSKDTKAKDDCVKNVAKNWVMGTEAGENKTTYAAATPATITSTLLDVVSF